MIDTVMLDYGGVVADHYSEPYVSRLAAELGTTRRTALDVLGEHSVHGKQYLLPN